MSYGYRNDTTQRSAGKLVALISSIAFLLIIGMIALGMWGCPTYNVWQQGLKGQAELKRADQNRRVQVVEAQAKLDATKLNAETAIAKAKFEAQAEVERAKGIAEANRIVADGLKGHDEYLRYLWIDKVAGQPGREIIYVPTEAAIPILESTRLAPPKPAER
jgi:hypothetical protein